MTSLQLQVKLEGSVFGFAFESVKVQDLAHGNREQFWLKKEFISNFVPLFLQ